jgi:hypothetical protein
MRNVDEQSGHVSAFMVCRQEKGICIILDTCARISEECPVATHRVGSVCPERSSSLGEQRSEVNCELAMHLQRDNR